MKTPPHILLIEPDRILTKQFETYFSDKGYRVTAAQDAQSAILAADNKTPDIIVLEVVLARHSGIEFLYEFRSYSEWQHVPVLILSRVSETDLRLTPKTKQDLHIHAVLYKPHTKLAKLEEVIESVLQAGTESS